MGSEMCIRDSHPRYHGPFEVLHRSEKHFTLSVNGKEKTVSIDRLKPAFEPFPPDNDADIRPRTRSPLPPQNELFREYSRTVQQTDTTSLTRPKRGRPRKKERTDAAVLSRPCESPIRNELNQPYKDALLVGLPRSSGQTRSGVSFRPVDALHRSR